MLKLDASTQSEPKKKQRVKKQERDVELAEKRGQGASAEDTDDEAAAGRCFGFPWRPGDHVEEMFFSGLGESTFHRHSEEVKEALDLEAEAAAFFQLRAPENTAHKLYKSVVTIHATEIDSPTFHDPEAEAESGEDTDNEQSQASVRGGVRGGPATIGGPGRGDVRGGPATGGMRELAKDWVIVKKDAPFNFWSEVFGGTKRWQT